MTIGKRIGIGFGMPLGFLVVIGGLSYWSTSKLIETSHWVSHTHQVLEGLESLASLLKDAETGQRGYIITGNESYLEPYQAALARNQSGPRPREAIDRGQPETPDEDRPAASPDREQAGGTQGNHRPAPGERSSKPRPRSSSNDSGKQFMDEIRKLLATISEAERELLKQRSEEAETTAVHHAARHRGRFRPGCSVRRPDRRQHDPHPSRGPCVSRSTNSRRPAPR